eukprot:6446768-Amphidinium_carterae.1
MELSVDKSEFMLCSLKPTDKKLQPVVCDPDISRSRNHCLKGAVLNKGTWDNGKLCIEHDAKRYYCMRVRGNLPTPDVRWNSNTYYDIQVAPLLPVVCTMDILGLRLENTLSYGTMCKKLKEAVSRRMAILSRLQCYSFGPPISTYRQLARGFVLAPLCYCLPVIFYDMAQSIQLKLPALEPGVCRLICGLPYGTSHVAAVLLSEVQPIEVSAQKRAYGLSLTLLAHSHFSHVHSSIVNGAELLKAKWGAGFMPVVAPHLHQYQARCAVRAPPGTLPFSCALVRSPHARSDLHFLQRSGTSTLRHYRSIS